MSIEAICVSVNFDVFIGTSWREHARKFYFQHLWQAGELTTFDIPLRIVKRGYCKVVQIPNPEGTQRP